MTDDHPRLLVVTEFAPNASGGGPSVVRQMLKGWPTDQLHWWSCFPDVDQRFGFAVSKNRVARIPSRLYPNRRLGRFKAFFMRRFWTPWASRNLKDTIKLANPEVVWAIPHGWAIPPAAHVLTRRTVGFHVSVHDNADVSAVAEKVGNQCASWMSDLAYKLYSRADTRDVISSEMRDDWRAHTGLDGDVCRAGLEPEDLEYLSNKAPAKREELRIAYAGTILVESAFQAFVSALKEIRNRLPPLTLEFFSSHVYRDRPWFDGSWMRENGNFAERELAAALQQCDWGFSPMSMSDDDPRYNRFSLPTKFVSYLAAGLPIIVMGHPESTVTKMAQSYRVGVVLNSSQPAQLGEQLLAALAIRNPWEIYRAGILRCSSEEFDAEKMRKTLHSRFRTCAE